jgi:hypothetical protein
MGTTIAITKITQITMAIRCWFFLLKKFMLFSFLVHDTVTATYKPDIGRMSPHASFIYMFYFIHSVDERQEQTSTKKYRHVG